MIGYNTIEKSLEMYFPGLGLGLLLPRTSCVTSDEVLSHPTPQLYSEHKDACITVLIRE